MQYMGSKNRIAKHILPIILKDACPSTHYYEPFVGGGNMIDKVGLEHRHGSDICEHLIDCLKLIRDNSQKLPQSNANTNEELYQHIKKHGNVTSGMYGYYGFALSYGGKWFGGWRRDKDGKRDYVKEAYNNAQKQSKNLQGVSFNCCSYDEIRLAPNSIVYCDPPYKGTTKYKNDFDHDKFWQWCRDKSKEGHKVFISEYTAPDDFECVWKKEQVSSLTKDTGSKKAVEKLFKVRV